MWQYRVLHPKEQETGHDALTMPLEELVTQKSVWEKEFQGIGNYFSDQFFWWGLLCQNNMVGSPKTRKQ